MPKTVVVGCFFVLTQSEEGSTNLHLYYIICVCSMGLYVLVKTYGNPSQIDLNIFNTPYLFFTVELFHFIYLLLVFIYRTHVLTPLAVSRFASLFLYPSQFFQLRLSSSVCYRTSSVHPKYEITGVKYTALCDHSLLQP